MKAAWTEAENRRRFGWTTDPPGHGHLYRVEVTIAGRPDPETSMIVDLARLDSILAETITAPLSGNHLNEVVPEFASGRDLPTCEALATWCWQRLSDRVPSPARLERVRVAEDESLWAECVAQPSSLSHPVP